MVQILEDNNFGSQMGKALTGGLMKGRERRAAADAERAKARQEFELFQEYFGKQVGVPQKPTEGMGDQLQSGAQAFGEVPQNEFNEMQEAWLNDKYPKAMEGRREREKINRKKFEADRTYHTTRSSKFLDNIDATANGIPEREIALKAAESGVKSGQMSPLGGDFWFAVTGINALKSASGAQLEAAAKVNLIGSLERLGARPNQFIEKVSNSAFAQAGESEEAQTAKLLIARSVLDLDKEKIRLTHQISNEDREKYGFVKEDVSSRVDKALQPIAKERMNELSFSLQQNIESDIGIPNLSKNATKPVMSGTYLTPEMAHVLKDALISAGQSEKDLNKMAVKLGYEIPSNKLLEKMGYVKE